MISAAYAMGQSGAPGQSGGGAFGGLLMILIIFGIFYFLLVRPQMKKQKQHQAMIGSLKKGDQVVTAGGIHGSVVGLKDDIVVLKIADQVKVEVSRNCIATIKERGSGE
jgi:preprotein translocase subunit YajC